MCEPRSSRFILWLLLLLYALKEISWNWFSQRLNESRSQILLNIHKKYCLIKKLMWSDISWLQIGSWWTFWFVLVWQFSSYEIGCVHYSLSLSLKRKREIERELGYTSKKIHSHLQRLSFHLSCWIVEKILYNLISNVSTWFPSFLNWFGNIQHHLLWLRGIAKLASSLWRNGMMESH